MESGRTGEEDLRCAVAVVGRDRRHTLCPGATGEPDPWVSASSSEIRVQSRCALESNVAVGLCVECLFLEMRP